MNTVDIIVLAIIGLSTIIAFLRGFVREILTIGSWIGASFATLYGYGYLKPIFEHWIKMKLAADIASGFVLFVGTLIILSLVSHTLARNVRGSGLTAVDRSLGLLFGLLRGATLVSLAYLVLTSFDPTIFKGAKTEPMMARGADLLRNLVPKDFAAEMPKALPISAPAEETPSGGDAKPDNMHSPAYNKRQNEAMQRLIDATSKQ